MSLAKACPTCGTPLPEDAPDDAVCEACLLASPDFATLAAPVVGTTAFATATRVPLGAVGDYEILDKLGQGGMGTVYRARQISLDRLVALKVLPPHCLDDDDAVRRFQREARVAASLSHPNLVRVYGSGEADGTHYIAMELVEGENLRQRLKRGPLPMEDAVRVCLAVARGLEAGWERAHLVHRDIKPSNIYLSTGGDVKVGDLGIAKSLAENTTGLTATGAALGTALYMSPEQARGEKQIDFRADIYSLGFTLYECLTGQPGYAGTQPSVLISQHLNAAPPGLLRVLPACPMPVVRLFGRMVKKQARERHNSYAELIAQLESVLDHLANLRTSTLLAAPAPAPGEHQPTLVTTAIPVTPVPARKSPALLYGGLVAAVLAIAATVFLLTRLRDTEPTPAQRLAERRAQQAAQSAAGVSPVDESLEAGSKTAGKPSAPIAEKSPIRQDYPVPRQWIDATAQVREIGLQRGTLRVDGDWLEATRTDYLPVGESRDLTDVLVRIVYTNRIAVRLRHDIVNNTGYTGEASYRSTRIAGEFNPAESLADWVDYEGQYDSQTAHELVFVARGHQLQLWIDGKLMASANDSRLPRGRILVAAYHSETGRPPRIKQVQYGELEGSTLALPAAPTISAIATKDAPFVNGLGMKFVPVPITGGPTDGQRVLFSVWETRVQDYEVFVRETGREWNRATDVEQGPTHPAVNVSWEDATAFCAWLTERERKAGKLGEGEVYRLPTDHEWSCAVGLGEREDAAKTPGGKDQKISDVFPWGSAWPPPENSGNYWSEELRPLLAAGKFTWIKGELPGYRDGFVTTAPVGSYAANPFGLHDLGGNVWEWCEDWFNAEQTRRVLRGASWDYHDRGDLLAAERGSGASATRYNTYGFRCVVAMSAR
jgi:hypothetical protein